MQLRKKLQKTEKTVQSLHDKMGEKGKLKAPKESRVKAPLKIQVM